MSLPRSVGVQLLVQFEAVLVTVAWSAIATVVIVLLTKLATGLRVDPEQEAQGLDFGSHGETAYNLNG